MLNILYTVSAARVWRCVRPLSYTTSKAPAGVRGMRHALALLLATFCLVLALYAGEPSGCVWELLS